MRINLTEKVNGKKKHLEARKAEGFTAGKAKYLAAAAIMLVLAFTLAGCGEGRQDAVQPEEMVDYEVALITDDSLIMDGGHSEAAWTAITDFCATHGMSHKYFKAIEATDRAYEDAIKTAVDNGAKIIITDGYTNTMADAVLDAQETYPEVDFLLLNTDPTGGDKGELDLADNTAAATFDSAQAGYLAGYCAVLDGYTKLGFIGEEKTSEISDYGYGFLKGANRAARENDINVYAMFTYCDKDAKSEDNIALADEWYAEGVEVIMACGDSVDEDIIRAAEASGGKVIACMSDKNELSDTVVTSAVVNVDVAIDEILDMYKKDSFPGGEVINYNASSDGIGLALKESGFANLSQNDYDKIYDKLKSGKVQINLEGINSVKEMKLSNLTFGMPEETTEGAEEEAQAQ